jgi:hypothetical protein
VVVPCPLSICGYGRVVHMVDMCGQTDGTTVLHAASFNGHVEAVRALVELGAAVNQAEVGCWSRGA